MKRKNERGAVLAYLGLTALLAFVVYGLLLAFA
jgi:hypothetical protein